MSTNALSLDEQIEIAKAEYTRAEQLLANLLMKRRITSQLKDAQSDYNKAVIRQHINEEANK